MPRDPHGPLVFELDQTELPDAPSPADAPPLDDPLPAATQKALAIAARGRRWGLGALALSLLGALLSLVVGVALADFVAGLFAENAFLGGFGLALLVTFLAVLAAICLR